MARIVGKSRRGQRRHGPGGWESRQRGGGAPVIASPRHVVVARTRGSGVQLQGVLRGAMTGRMC